MSRRFKRGEGGKWTSAKDETRLSLSSRIPFASLVTGAKFGHGHLEADAELAVGGKEVSRILELHDAYIQLSNLSYLLLVLLYSSFTA